VSDAQRKAILEAAARDQELVSFVPAVVASGFGVLALRRIGDILTVACLPRVNRRALRMLRDVLGAEIVATPFDERLLHEAIQAAYFPEDEGVNFPTFLDPDFLDDPRNAAVLRHEKEEHPGLGRLDLPPHRLALASLEYRSSLSSLDGPVRSPALPDLARTKLDLGELELAWTRTRAGRVAVHAPDGLSPTVALALTEVRATEYHHVTSAHVSEHAVRGSLLDQLPHVVHPTEVQLVSLEVDGALGFHLYDHLERVPTDGAPRTFRLGYHFLSYGARLRREILITVHALTTVARSEVEVHNRPLAWGPDDLARWLGVTRSNQVVER
jgi:hypothetical protein